MTTERCLDAQTGHAALYGGRDAVVHGRLAGAQTAILHARYDTTAALVHAAADALTGCGRQRVLVARHDAVLDAALRRQGSFTHTHTHTKRLDALFFCVALSF